MIWAIWADRVEPPHTHTEVCSLVHPSQDICFIRSDQIRSDQIGLSQIVLGVGLVLSATKPERTRWRGPDFLLELLKTKTNYRGLLLMAFIVQMCIQTQVICCNVRLYIKGLTEGWFKSGRVMLESDECHRIVGGKG